MSIAKRSTCPSYSMVYFAAEREELKDYADLVEAVSLNDRFKNFVFLFSYFLIVFDAGTTSLLTVLVDLSFFVVLPILGCKYLIKIIA